MSVHRKLLSAAIAALVLGSSSLALLGDEKVDDMRGLISLLFRGFTLAREQSKLVNAFIDKSTNCVVITSKTPAVWKFGYLSSYKSELQAEQCGSFTVQTVTTNFKSWDDLGPMAPDAPAVAIPGNYGAIVLKPVFVKTGLASWKDFFRVCYLEDRKGQRIYLNITAPGKLTSSVPRVGIAAASLAAVMKDGRDPMAEKLLSIYSPTEVKEKKLQSLDMISIGQETVK